MTTLDTLSFQKALDSSLIPSIDGVERPFNKGMRMIAVKRNNQLFLASSHNTFAGLRYKLVKIHNGIDSVLLYFPNWETIVSIGDKFHHDCFSFLITSFRNGIAYIKIECSKRFKVTLCCDLLPNFKPFPMHTLMFALCADDVTHILHKPELCLIRSKLQRTRSLATLRNLEGQYTARRRGHVLVGQSLLGPNSIHEHGDVQVVYDSDLGFAGNYDALCDSIRYQLNAADTSSPEQELFWECLDTEPNDDDVISINSVIEGEFPHHDTIAVHIIVCVADLAAIMSRQPDWINCVVNPTEEPGKLIVNQPDCASADSNNCDSQSSLKRRMLKRMWMTMRTSWQQLSLS